MRGDYSLEALLEFADYLGKKGLLNKNTANSRKAACSKVFAVLAEDEASDLREVDIDQVAMRFNNLEGSNYSPESLRVYKSRASTALSDFFRYKRNPAAFKIETSSRKARGATAGAEAGSSKASGNVAPGAADKAMSAARSPETVDIPIPLRPNCIVYLNGLPIDLSESEAKKIGNVVAAMAVATAK